MATQTELDKAWKNVLLADGAIREELAAMRRAGKRSERYQKLKADLQKAKDEYEKIKGGGTHNPLDPDSSARLQRNKVIRAFTGKEGPDSHTRQEY